MLSSSGGLASRFSFSFFPLLAFSRRLRDAARGLQLGPAQRDHARERRGEKPGEKEAEVDRHEQIRIGFPTVGEIVGPGQLGLCQLTRDATRTIQVSGYTDAHLPSSAARNRPTCMTLEVDSPNPLTLPGTAAVPAAGVSHELSGTGIPGWVRGGHRTGSARPPTAATAANSRLRAWPGLLADLRVAVLQQTPRDGSWLAAPAAPAPPEPTSGPRRTNRRIRRP